MRYGIFADIHSNLEAFEAVIEAYAKENIDRYLCLGDILGYATDIKGCIKKTRGLANIVIAGNHDWGSLGSLDLEYFNPQAKKAVIWTRDRLEDAERDFLQSLSLVYEYEEFTIVHSTLDNPQEFRYLREAKDAKDVFDLMSKNLCFVGHTHRPGFFVQDGDVITYSSALVTEISPNKKYIVNVGSVGQPRDRDNRAAYCIYDTDSKTVEIKRIAYDFKRTQAKIVNAGLPLFFASRLEIGM